MLQRMGADIRLHRAAAAVAPPASRSPTSRCARAACTASPSPRRWCRWRSTSSRCSSSPPPAPRGETVVRGAHELRVKESDRLAATAAGLAVLGVEHQLLPDGLWLRGGAGFRRAARIDSRGDHRIAMAFAVAALQGAGADRDPGRGQCRHLLPRLRRHRPRERLADPGAVTEPPAGMNRRAPRPPVATIDGPSGSGQGHDQPGGRPARRLAPARQRGAVPPGGPGRGALRGRRRMIPGRMPGWPGPCEWSSGPVPDGSEQVRLDGRGRDRRHPLGDRRAGRLPRGGLACRCARPSWSASGPSPPSRAWSPTAAIWAPWSSPGPPSRSS